MVHGNRLAVLSRRRIGHHLLDAAPVPVPVPAATAVHRQFIFGEASSDDTTLQQPRRKGARRWSVAAASSLYAAAQASWIIFFFFSASHVRLLFVSPISLLHLYCTYIVSLPLCPINLAWRALSFFSFSSSVHLFYSYVSSPTNCNCF